MVIISKINYKKVFILLLVYLISAAITQWFTKGTVDLIGNLLGAGVFLVFVIIANLLTRRK